MAKYKLGDKFVRKMTRDTDVMKVISIKYPYLLNEPEYTLLGVRFGPIMQIGEEALTELYNLIP